MKSLFGIGENSVDTHCLLLTLPNDRFLDWIKLETFAEDKFGRKIQFSYRKGRKHYGKKKNGSYHHFPIFPNVFERLLSEHC